MATEHERDLARQRIDLGGGKNFSEEEKAKLLSDENIRGKRGFASTRIRAHYGDSLDAPGLTEEERKKTLDLSTEEGRMAALGGMRQNADPMSPDGAFRCGASSLVGGMMYGGGKEGVQMLLDAMMADRTKLKLGDASKDQPWMDDGMKKLMEKLKNKESQLSVGDMEMIQSKTYQFFKDQKPGGQNKGEGLSGEMLQKFIAGHKDIKKLFADKDMGLDGVDLSGDGRSDHLVLGIGHDPMNAGARRMVYDPQARQDKDNWGEFMKNDDVDKLRMEERKKMQARFDAVNARATDPDYVKKIDALQAELETNVKQKQFAYKHGSQLVTDAQELRDYRTATDYEANANKIVDHKAQTAPLPYYGMF